MRLPKHIRTMISKDPKLAREIHGMKVGEALFRAAKWWNEKGRHAMRTPEARSFVTKEVKRVSKSSPVAPLVIVKEREIDLPQSGILQGKVFDDLTREEQSRIVRGWLLEFHVKPQLPKTVEPTPGLTLPN